MLLLDEPEHMAQRKLMLPPFHGKRMHAYGEVMARVAAEEIDRWPTDAPVRMRARMQAITLELILRAVFGVEEGERLTRLRSELRSILDLSAKPRRAMLGGGGGESGGDAAADDMVSSRIRGREGRESVE